MAENLDVKEYLDMDVIIAGGLLHDIGKIICYKTADDSVDVSDKLIEQEHIISGISIVATEIKSKKLEQIKHVIASHHYLKEWGSPVPPNSFEAWIVYFADNLSAKLC